MLGSTHSGRCAIVPSDQISSVIQGGTMSDEALKALREKYGNAKGSDVFDPEFKKVVSLVFKSSGSR